MSSSPVVALVGPAAAHGALVTWLHQHAVALPGAVLVCEPDLGAVLAGAGWTVAALPADVRDLPVARLAFAVVLEHPLAPVSPASRVVGVWAQRDGAPVAATTVTAGLLVDGLASERAGRVRHAA